MKTPNDPRHKKRIAILKDLFALSFHKQPAKIPDTKKIIQVFTILDSLIAKAAPQWPLDKVAKVDLAILRLATYELMFVKKVPPKVVVDEAVELAKEFGGENSGPFVNGVLGTIIKEQQETKKFTEEMT